MITKNVNASTWSVFGRLINSSHWPLLLGADTASDRKVLKRIRGMSWLSSVATVLLGVAAAITPLGLHMTIRLVDQEKTWFTYVRDTSAIGRTTLDRTTYRPNRLCGFPIWENCPGNDNGFNSTTFPNGTTWVYTEPGRKTPYISSSYARNISEVFGSVKDDKDVPDTVAGFLISSTERGKKRTLGLFQYYQQFLLDSKIEAVEGLIVSTADTPGIGFRNHTLPPESEHGYTWTEDTLWLELETVCTDLNITLDYVLPKWKAPSIVSEAYLTDRGDLANTPASLPNDIDIASTQFNPRIFEKSYTGAFVTDAILKGLMNRTQDELTLGKRYPVSRIRGCERGMFDVTPNQLSFGEYGVADRLTNYWDPNLPGYLFFCETSLPSSSRKALRNDVYMQTLISEQGGLNPQRPSQVALGAGLMQGVGIPLDDDGQPIDTSRQAEIQSATRWSQPFFSCVSAIKASVKTVQFEIEGPPAIKNLRILSINPSSATVPIWAVENTSWSLSDINPLWGLISKQQISHGGISTFEKPELYLPAGASSVAAYGMSADDANAGTTAPLAALNLIYHGEVLGDFSGDNGFASVPDFSGANNWPLLLEWSRLVRNASTAGRVIDLIWTDLMANMLVGAKGGLPNDAASVLRPAARNISVVAYDWRYAGVSLVFAALYLTMLIASLLVCIFKRCNFTVLRFFLDQTAAGRSVTTERFQAKSGADVGKNKDWAVVRGDETVLIGREDLKSRP